MANLLVVKYAGQKRNDVVTGLLVFFSGRFGSPCQPAAH